MSGSFTIFDSYAFDEHGKAYLMYERYSYSNGCGYYHELIGVNGQEFESKLYVAEDEEFTTGGTKPPYISSQDVQSYFTANPSYNIQEILRLNALTDVNIVSFLNIWVNSVLAGPYEASCHIITKDSISQHEHNVWNEALGDDVETVVKNLLDKYTPKST